MYNPANTEELEFYFRGDKMAKVIGRAADEQSDGRVNGLLIKRSLNNYIILDPSELEDHSNLKLSTVSPNFVPSQLLHRRFSFCVCSCACMSVSYEAMIIEFMLLRRAIDKN